MHNTYSQRFVRESYRRSRLFALRTLRTIEKHLWRESINRGLSPSPPSPPNKRRELHRWMHAGWKMTLDAYSRRIRDRNIFLVYKKKKKKENNKKREIARAKGTKFAPLNQWIFLYISVDVLVKRKACFLISPLGVVSLGDTWTSTNQNKYNASPRQVGPLRG